MCRKSPLRHLKQSRLIFNLPIPKASRRNPEDIARQSPLLTPPPMSVPKTTPVFHTLFTLFFPKISLLPLQLYFCKVLDINLLEKSITITVVFLHQRSFFFFIIILLL